VLKDMQKILLIVLLCFVAMIQGATTGPMWQVFKFQDQQECAHWLGETRGEESATKFLGWCRYESNWASLVQELGSEKAACARLFARLSCESTVSVN